MKLYHGSPELFSAFDLNKASEGTGVKFGFGVYLTESEASAVHYSQPRNMEQMAPNHYLYIIEIPDLTPTNHLVSALPVNEEIVSKVQATGAWEIDYAWFDENNTGLCHTSNPYGYATGGHAISNYASKEYGYTNAI